MSKTRAELIDQALTDLGVIAEGQSIDSNLVTKMDGIVDPAIAELADLDIYYVQDAGTAGPPTGGEIEDSAFLSLSAYIANAACSAFNLPADAKLTVKSAEAVAKLITLAAPKRTLRTLRIDPLLTRHRTGTYRG